MLIIHDIRLPAEYTDKLKEKFPFSELFPFCPGQSKVYGSIASHPDIYFFQADKRTFVCAPGISPARLSELRSRGIVLIEGDKSPGGAYPSTALYNAARVADKVFLNKKYADKAVLETIEKKAFTLVDVPQGYARCSILPVGKRAFITSDRKIADAGRKNDLEVLEVSCGCVDLPGENLGFIGGAGGLTCNGETVLLGDARFHPDGDKINDFIQCHSQGYIYAEDLPIYDAGSLFFLNTADKNIVS